MIQLLNKSIGIEVITSISLFKLYKTNFLHIRSQELMAASTRWRRTSSSSSISRPRASPVPKPTALLLKDGPVLMTVVVGGVV